MTDSSLNEILERISKIELRLEALEGSGPVNRTQKQVSMREFLNAINPKDDVERTLAIGYYAEHYAGHDSFNAKDIEDGYRTAKSPVPPNINDKVNLNIKKGFMMESREKKLGKKSWVLTASGEDYVKSKFENQSQG